MTPRPHDELVGAWLGAAVADGLTVARIKPGRAGTPGSALRALGTALFRRHTNRGPYAQAVVPARIIDGLRTAAATDRWRRSSRTRNRSS